MPLTGGFSSTKNLDKEFTEIKDLIIRGQIKIESLLSNILETEMITQDQYDKLMNLLIEFGKKKGWK